MSASRQLAGCYDFTGYQVLVVGGTRGVGHMIASALVASGATVTVTGTMILRSLYDADLSAFDYESVNLARQDSIDHLVGSLGDLDVLIHAGACHLPVGLPEHERSFVAQAARSGLLGPRFLTTRLRLKLGQSPALGGGCVVHTPAAARWLELASSPEAARTDLVEATARAGANWAGLGVRVNTVLAPPSPTPDAVADATLFLASSAAAHITGQTLRIS